METAFRRCGALGAVAAALWLVLAGPAYLLAGSDGLLGLSISAGLCLVPGWLVFVLMGHFDAGNSQAFVVLAGTALRMLFVLGGILVVLAVRSDLGMREFLVWVIVYYLVLLLAETLIVVKRNPA